MPQPSDINWPFTIFLFLLAMAPLGACFALARMAEVEIKPKGLRTGWCIAASMSVALLYPAISTLLMLFDKEEAMAVVENEIQEILQQGAVGSPIAPSDDQRRLFGSADYCFFYVQIDDKAKDRIENARRLSGERDFDHKYRRLSRHPGLIRDKNLLPGARSERSGPFNRFALDYEDPAGKGNLIVFVTVNVANTRSETTSWQRYSRNPLSGRETPTGDPYSARVEVTDFSLDVWVYDRGSDEVVAHKVFTEDGKDGGGDPFFQLYAWLQQTR